jgi:hypothetical protein
MLVYQIAWEVCIYTPTCDNRSTSLPVAIILLILAQWLSRPDDGCQSYDMSKLSILRLLPLLAIVTPLAVVAGNAAESLSLITLGEQYAGTLTVSANNPQGEVCYQLAVKPDTRITLKAKTSGVGILKFAVYDKAKALQFFHNTANNKSVEGDATSEQGFSFLTTKGSSQLCLSTTNPQDGQKYEFTLTGKPNRGIRVRQPLPPVSSVVVPPPPSIEAQAAPVVQIPPPPPIEAQAAPIVQIPPPPSIESQAAPSVQMPPPPMIAPKVAIVPTNKVAIPTIDLPLASPIVSALPSKSNSPYCYVGTWQISDLSAYWLPIVQNFTQAKVTEPRMVGYGKLTIARDGRAVFEAIDLEQKYALKTTDTGAKIDSLEFLLGGRAAARFRENPDSTLTFSSQNYQRLSSKLNLGEGMELNGDRLFTIFGDRLSPTMTLPYKCIDADNIVLKIPLPFGKQLVPISLKRIN